MVLNNFVEWRFVRSFFLGSMLFGALFIAGCGSSEEAMMEEDGFEDTAAAEQPTEAKAEEGGDQQALTSFIGAAPKKEEKAQETVAQPPPQQVQAAPASPAEDLRTENTSLKQKVVKLEQDVRTLNARISDTESKYMSEKERADKAEEAAKVAAQSAVISARGSQVTAPSESMTPATEASMGSYDGALQLFRSKKYDESIGALQNLLNSGVPPTLEDNCHYWIGEGNFGKRNYAEAMKHFEMVLQFKGSEKLADSHYMVAQCYERTGNKAKAKEAYERVVKDFPMSNLVPKAKERWARL